MYEKGMALVNRCREILDRAEKRIELLTMQDGKLKAEPTDLAGEPATSGADVES
jgi:exonuclease VII small subunit